MKIRSVASHGRKPDFVVVTRSGAEYSFPYEKADPVPGTDDPIVRLFVDKELGSEAFTYELESDQQGSVHIDQVLEYNEDPQYLADLLAYKSSIGLRSADSATGRAARRGLPGE